MKYYLIDYSANATEPEWYRYDGRLTKGYNQNSLNFNFLPNYDPVFVPIILNLKRKRTDVLLRSLISGAGLTFNEKVKNILLEHNLINTRFYELKVLQFVKGPNRGVEVDNPPKYFHMQIVTCDFWDWIDYEKSEFYIEDVINGNRYDISFKNAQDIKLKYSNIKHTSASSECIKFKKLAMNNLFKSQEIDMFYIWEIRTNPFPGILISEKLRERLVMENVTGLSSFIEVNIISS